MPLLGCLSSDVSSREQQPSPSLFPEATQAYYPDPDQLATWRQTPARSRVIREMRQNLSRYVQRVRHGEPFLISDRGQEIAQLSPAPGRSTVIDRLVAALHLATACSLGTDVERLYCYDGRLAHAAAARGIDVSGPR